MLCAVQIGPAVLQAIAKAPVFECMLCDPDPPLRAIGQNNRADLLDLSDLYSIFIVGIGNLQPVTIN